MKNENELLNVWDKISIWCLNHEKPLPMEITQNNENFKTPFYACPNRVKENKSRGRSSPVCANRLNLDDYQGIVFKLNEIIIENPFTNITNYTFSYRGARQKIYVKVLKYDDNSIELGIRNLTVIG